MKKFLAILVCLCLLSSVAFAADKTPDGELPIYTNGPETFTAYMTDNTSYMYMDETNRALQHYAEETGVWLDVVLGDIKLLMAAGNYPELIFSAGFSAQEVYDYGLQGLVIELTDLLDKHATFLKQAQEEHYPYMWQDWTSPDGNIYGIATSGSSFGGNTQKMYINTKWLADLGLEMPKTIHEFEDVLKAFKEYDTTVAPLTGAVNTWNAEPQYWLLNNFILTDKSNYFLYQEEEGKIGMAANKDAFRDGLAWANSLYEQGLIDPGAFTQELTALQAYNADDNNPHLGVVALGHKRMITNEAGGYQLDKSYTTIGPVLNDNGTSYAPWWDNGRTSGAQFCITDICHDPDGAMRFLNYWVTPETFFWNWMGDEGHNYVPAEEGQLNYLGEQALINDLRWFTDFVSIDKANGNDMEAMRLVQYPTTPWAYWELAHAVEGPGVAEANWWKYDIADLGNEALMSKAFVGEQNLPLGLGSLRTSEEQGAIIMQYGLAINNYINENIVAFITGTKDVEADWDAYVAGLEANGLAQFMEVAQAAYDEHVFGK